MLPFRTACGYIFRGNSWINNYGFIHIFHKQRVGILSSGFNSLLQDHPQGFQAQPTRGLAGIPTPQAKVRDQFLDLCNNELRSLKRDSLYRAEEYPTFPGLKPPHIRFAGHLRKLIDFSGTDYLGLSYDPEVVAAYNQALVVSGMYSGSRLLEGAKVETLELETTLANFHQREDCWSFSNVKEAVTGLFKTMFSTDGTILIDEKSSLIPYLETTGATVITYNHLNLGSIRDKLNNRKGQGKVVIMTDTVYPASEAVVPIPDILKLAGEFNCSVVVEDTYGMGVHKSPLGEIERRSGVQEGSTIVITKLESILGQQVGGYIAGPRWVVEQFYSKVEPAYYPCDLPPPIVAAVSKMLNKIPHSSEEMEILKERATKLRNKLSQHGLLVSRGTHPTLNINVGSSRTADNFAEQLRDNGLYCVVCKYPVVAKDEARLSVSLTVHHTQEHIDILTDNIVTVGKRLKVIR